MFSMGAFIFWAMIRLKPRAEAEKEAKRLIPSAPGSSGLAAALRPPGRWRSPLRIQGRQKR
jgi:hypothetical protein